jgi:hypothetical protein
MASFAAITGSTGLSSISHSSSSHSSYNVESSSSSSSINGVQSSTFDGFAAQNNNTTIMPVPRVYQLFNYEGHEAALGVGAYNVLTDDQVGDDAISSARVPGGWEVTLYTDPDLKGASLVLTSDQPRFDSAFNNKVSSIKVERHAKLSGFNDW